MPRITDLRPRRGTAAAWMSANPVLGAGEFALETDTRRIKFGDGTTAWNSLGYAEASAAGKADTAWIVSRGTDLVSNGTGLLGNNTNFSSFTFSPDAPMGAAGAFDYSGPGTLFNDEDIPVDTSRRYLARMMVKQRNPNVPSSRFYAGLSPRDKQGLTILPHHYWYEANAHTTLTSALNPGDTVINVTSTANWNAAAAPYTSRYAAVWNWADPAGRVWPEKTYTRNVLAYNSITATTVTLAAAYAGPAMPAGTPVSNTKAGGNYMYSITGNAIAPLDWAEFSGTVGGLHDSSTGPATTKFPPGTAFIRLLFLATYSSSVIPAGETSTQSFGAISFSDATQALKELDSTQAALALKAPLASPAFTGTPTGITKTHVGLGNVDNTADTAKPVSTAQQTALNAKENTIAPGTTVQFWRGDKTWQPIEAPVSTFAALQTAAAAGGVVRLAGTITATASINVTLPTQFIGGKIILPENAGYPAFSVTSSNVTFDGIRFSGPGTTAAYSIDSRFIYAVGTSSAPLKNVNVTNCEMIGSQTENIRYTWVQGSNISNNVIDDFLYAGVLLLSCQDVGVMNNTVTNGPLKAPVVNTYGIGATDSANTVAGRCKDIRIIGNTIRNIEWEAIDTHGGDGVIIIGNVISGSARGIALVVGNETRLTVPINCVVQGNKIEKGSYSGSEREAISLFGLSGNLADATITGNIVRGYSAANSIWLSAYINPAKTLIEGNSHPHIPWTNMTLDNTASWTVNASFPPQYMLEGRMVHLRGFATAASSSTVNTRIGTLPAVCAPDRLTFVAASHGSNSAAATGVIGVYPTGEVWMLYRTTPGDLYSYPVEGSYQRAFG